MKTNAIFSLHQTTSFAQQKIILFNKLRYLMLQNTNLQLNKFFDCIYLMVTLSNINIFNASITQYFQIFFNILLQTP